MLLFFYISNNKMVLLYIFKWQVNYVLRKITEYIVFQ